MRLAFILFISIFCASQATSASAQETVDATAILAKVDAAATRAKDFTARVELATIDAKGKTTKRTFSVWQKGQRRMLKLTKPARLKGVGMLATNPDELHMYLPSFGRVRRVAGRKRGSPFLGSNFTQDDMVRTRYASRFSPALVKQDETTWTLQLSPKKPDDEPYHHLVLTVRKSDSLVSNVDLFDAESSQPSRQIEASDFREVGSVPFAHTITATDLEDKSRSTAVLHDVRVDTGLEDSYFSQRHLKRKP